MTQLHDAATTPSAAAFVPSRPTLARLAAAAHACEGCALYKAATQTVFGVGPRAAALMWVGEQPGDREDIAGVPFIGPAGQLLR